MQNGLTANVLNVGNVISLKINMAFFVVFLAVNTRLTSSSSRLLTQRLNITLYEWVGGVDVW